jgi:hypothetical protein
MADSNPKRKREEGVPLAGASGYSAQQSDQGPFGLAKLAYLSTRKWVAYDRFRRVSLGGAPVKLPLTRLNCDTRDRGFGGKWEWIEWEKRRSVGSLVSVWERSPI